jgi:hypothetical protein
VGRFGSGKGGSEDGAEEAMETIPLGTTALEEVRKDPTIGEGSHRTFIHL